MMEIMEGGRADYPLHLTPYLAERVWGGSTLGEGIGEAWDLSVHPHGPSTIANGPLAGRSLADVNAAHPDDFGGPIELLAKRLDCAQDLSVQVHPKEGDPKTEAWIVLQAEEGAGVYHGFSGEIDAEQLRAAALDGTLPERLRFLEVQPGQCVFVPSGTVHAIGRGLLLFELQQSADVTYRLFDWGRGRDLQLDEGIACSDLENTEAIQAPTLGVRLVKCDHFFVDRIHEHEPYELNPRGKWVAAFVLTGSCNLGELELGAGETVVVPRAAGTAMLEPHGAFAALVYGP